MYFLHAREAGRPAPSERKSSKFAKMLDIITVTSNTECVALRLLQELWGKRYG